MRYKNWNRRWFVLSDKFLYYFELTTVVVCVSILETINQVLQDKKPKGFIPLENIRVRPVEDKSRPFVFEIFSNSSEVVKACKTDADGNKVAGNHTAYRLAAASADEMNSWINAIQ